MITKKKHTGLERELEGVGLLKFIKLLEMVHKSSSQQEQTMGSFRGSRNPLMASEFSQIHTQTHT